ncbi:hypothetical protein [Haloferax volcanii]|uniref:hypothetical protein n=1 Tax=Haloferax volcanii TaxID=2246 RepID=UPI0023DC5193|nr:hypothetical protein [Haloferax lucentense]WEL28017.1 Putative transcriptional regulator [Haloferax lucentense]
MQTSEVELPDWVESRIDAPNTNRSITQYQVAKEFVKKNRPYYNVSRMHAALGGNVSTDTVQSRLDELVERDVLKSEKVNNGFIYWLNHEDSDWPIPSDVEVEPERTEPTVNEWKNYGYVQLAAFSLIIVVIGTAVTLLGTFQTGGYYTTPWGASDIIAVGLSAGIMSYIGLFVAGLLWIFDVDELPNVGNFS